MRIERLVPCPPKELWWALIENAEATERGVMLRLALPGGVSQVAGKITRYESPTLLECCWDGNVLRWELEPRCEGTTHVVFTHGPDTEHLLACLDSIIAAGQERSSGTSALYRLNDSCSANRCWAGSITSNSLAPIASGSYSCG